MVETFRWAILSPGRIAHNFANAVNAIDNTEVVAVASSSSSRARNFADQYQIAHAYSDYAELLTLDQIDGVYISSVHAMHAKQARLALAAGKPVLCEKPITVNAAELADLIRLARAGNIFLMEALWTRYLPVIRGVRQWLDEGAIGQLHDIEASFGFVAQTPPEDRLRNPELAGGALLDIGIYPISMAQYFSGSTVVSYDIEASLGETGIDEQLSAELRFENDVRAIFRCSLRDSYENNLIIRGSRGEITIDAPFWGAETAHLENNLGNQTLHQPHLVNGFEYQIEAAMAAILKDETESQVMPLAQSLSTMRLMDDMRSRIGVIYPSET